MRFFRICSLLVLVVSFVACAHAKPKLAFKEFTKEEMKKMSEIKAVIETRFGNMELRFFPEVAPNHVNNFIELAKKGFYDGTIFHRVKPDLYILGGDPESKNIATTGQVIVNLLTTGIFLSNSQVGYGGPGYTIKSELNEKSLKRGMLGMVRDPLLSERESLLGERSSHPDSSGSQFFICLADQPGAGLYTVFGEVISGMDVADKIANQPVKFPWYREDWYNPKERIEMRVKVVE